MSETKDYRKELYVWVYVGTINQGKHMYDAETSARLAVEGYDRFFDAAPEDIEEPSDDEELFCAERSEDCEYRLITDRCTLPRTQPCEYRLLLKEPRKDGKIFLCDKRFDKVTCKHENEVGECGFKFACPRQVPIS